jgi:hypothetical protein
LAEKQGNHDLADFLRQHGGRDPATEIFAAVRRRGNPINTQAAKIVACNRVKP